MRIILVNILATLVIAIPKQSLAQNSDFTVKKHFLIALSSPDFQSAQTFAQKVASDLNLPWDSSYHIPDDSLGFISTDTCTCGINHGYIPRGRYDDGQYVSVEWSTAYNTFSDGLYVVIVASGPRKELKSFLRKVKQTVPTAYIKEADVYIGCMH
jgi:hypothetical protein